MSTMKVSCLFQPAPKLSHWLKIPSSIVRATPKPRHGLVELMGSEVETILDHLLGFLFPLHALGFGQLVLSSANCDFDSIGHDEKLS